MVKKMQKIYPRIVFFFPGSPIQTRLVGHMYYKKYYMELKGMLLVPQSLLVNTPCKTIIAY